MNMKHPEYVNIKNPQYVINSLSSQVATLAQEKALRDAIITEQQI